MNKLKFIPIILIGCISLLSCDDEATNLVDPDSGSSTATDTTRAKIAADNNSGATLGDTTAFLENADSPVDIGSYDFYECDSSAKDLPSATVSEKAVAITDPAEECVICFCLESANIWVTDGYIYNIRRGQTTTIVFDDSTGVYSCPYTLNTYREAMERDPQPLFYYGKLGELY